MLRLEFIYVVRGEFSFVKIGSCRPPDMPIDALRTGSIRALEIVWVAATNGEARAIEVHAQRRLGALRHTDEWVSLPAEAAVDAIRWAARDLDYPLLSVGPRDALDERGRRTVFAVLGATLRHRHMKIAAILIACGGLALANRHHLSSLWSAIFPVN